MPEGKYEWKIVANKDINQNIDFLPVSNDLELEDWAWWNNSWQHKKEIIINSTVASTLTDYTPYISMDTATLIAAGKMNDTCKDLRFLNSNNITELDYEIEIGTCNTPKTIIWTRIPSLTPGNYSIYAFYGNPLALDNQNLAGVWQNYSFVLHHNGWKVSKPEGYVSWNSSVTNTTTSWLSGENSTNHYPGSSASSTMLIAPHPGSFTINISKGFYVYWRIINRDNAWDNSAYVLNFYTTGARYISIGWCGADSGSNCDVDTDHYGYAYSRLSGSQQITKISTDFGYTDWHLIGYTGNKTSAQGLTYVDGIFNTASSLTYSDTGTQTYYIDGSYQSGIGQSGAGNQGAWNGTIGETRLGEFTATANWIKADNSQLSWVSTTEENYISINVTLVSPTNGAVQNPNPQAFIGLAASTDTLANMTLYTNATGSFTAVNTNSTINATKMATMYSTVTLPIIWNILVCDTKGDCLFSPQNYTLNQDLSLPTINFISPTTGQTFTQGIAENTSKQLYLNFTTTDPNIDKCWYSYNGGTTNTTYNCNGNVSLTLPYGTYSFVIWANDTFNNLAVARANNVVLNYHINLTELNYTQNVYETATTYYWINASSVSTAKLYLNGTSYSVIPSSGNIWNYTLGGLPGSKVGNNSLIWGLVYGGIEYNTTARYQSILPIKFGLCNGGNLSVSYLNISFKDEINSSAVSTTIASSSFYYYLGDGTALKNYLYSTTGTATSYAFCFSPGNTSTHLNYTLYYSAIGYPQRSTNSFSSPLYSNQTTNLTLYLLGSGSGQYVTFQTVSITNTPISGVEITISRTIGGEQVTVANGITDAAGTFTAWLNPLYPHTITAIKTGYTTNSQTITPTQPLYTLTMGTLVDTYTYVSDYSGLKWYATPGVGTIKENSSTFGFNISAQKNNLVKCKLELLNNDKTIILDFSENIATNSSKCYTELYYVLNETYPTVKGRLWVDVGNGYQILEDDAYWKFITIDSTGMTFTDWMGGLTKLPLSYFNNDEQHQEYTYILLFFLVVMIICASLNLFGWDVQTEGGMIFLVGIMVIIASVPGLLTLNYISPFHWIDKYFVAMVYTMFMIGFGARELFRG